MIALCLSGGGFRATLFHLGALRRLNELGALSQIDCFSSVSGGSILNGVLATRWSDLAKSETGGVFADFDKLIADPIRQFCRTDIRTPLLVWKRLRHCVELLQGLSLTNLLAKEYANQLLLGVPLIELPTAPQFIFCATNLATGVNWEFGTGAGGLMGDYRSGMSSASTATVAEAVAASSAFPLTFPPLKIARRTSKGQNKISWLSDGGVYDNLGLEPVWKSASPLLVSDGGQPLEEENGCQKWRMPLIGWTYRMQRVFSITYNQVGAIRKRWLIATFKSKHGTYWGIGSDCRNYRLADAHGYAEEAVKLFKRVRTDLNAFTDEEIACLENHGYALADTAMRKWVAHMLPAVMPEFRYPYPDWATNESAMAALAKSSSRCLLKDLWRSLRG